MHRAQRAGMAPQQYYDQLVRSGAAGAVFGDVRRGKALAAVHGAGHDQGLGRQRGHRSTRCGAEDEQTHDHDHEH